MISEHKFASHFTSIWRDIMPMGDRYWRGQNTYVESFGESFKSAGLTDIRGTVNELAFIVFCKLSIEAGLPSKEFALELAADSLSEAVQYTRRFSKDLNDVIAKVTKDSLEEAAVLALNQLKFFRSTHLVGRLYNVRPKFRGCGILNDCEGDVLTEDTLFEVKAGDRTFRITDLRQLLIYSALAHASGRLTFSKIGLLNPRTGIFWIRELDVVCRATSGLRSSDVFEALVDAVTQPLTSR